LKAQRSLIGYFHSILQKELEALVLGYFVREWALVLVQALEFSLPSSLLV
jgi:hypothetical protein